MMLNHRRKKRPATVRRRFMNTTVGPCANRGKVDEKARAKSTGGNRIEEKTNILYIKSRTVCVSSAYVRMCIRCALFIFQQPKGYCFGFCTHGIHYTNDFLQTMTIFLYRHLSGAYDNIIII